jgi:hypothetical protein
MVSTKELQTRGHTDIQDRIAKHPEPVKGPGRSRRLVVQGMGE